MDFFEAQDQARRRTKWLWLWFALAVIGVVIAVDLLLWLVLFQTSTGTDFTVKIIGASAITATLILAASGFKTLQLHGGGEVVAKDLGGRRIDSSTRDTEERRLMNVVEEMAIASGTPVPQVYVMDNEDGINAFAAGTEPANAVIGVTRGCIQRLSRDELQGVIAHEFSHILNGDMRMNIRLIGLIFGLVVISIIGRGLFEVIRFRSLGSRRSSREGGGGIIAILLIGVGLIVIGSIGVFFARLIQAAISRQREFLADASAVQFTRNPDGIANALKKIGGNSSALHTAKAGEASHLFFSDAGLFSFGLQTHPPLPIRIKAIQQNWDGEFSASNLPQVAEDRQEKKKTKKSGHALPFPEILAGLAGSQNLGDEQRTHLDTGTQIIAGIEPHWIEAIHDRQQAQALIFGLLLAEDKQLRDTEVIYLRQVAGKDATEMALGWQTEARALHSAKKIALIDLSLPALRRMSRPEYERFQEITRHLIASDSQIDLFEFMLQRVVERQLESYFNQVGTPRIRYHSLQELGEETNLLISTMAGVGSSDQAALQKAYHHATQPLVEKSSWPHTLAPPTDLSKIGEILDRCDAASPLVKRDLLQACARAAAADGILAEREAELLRAIAEAIGCSLPPFVSELKAA